MDLPDFHVKFETVGFIPYRRTADIIAVISGNTPQTTLYTDEPTERHFPG